jgi:hypothetical protein
MNRRKSKIAKCSSGVGIQIELNDTSDSHNVIDKETEELEFRQRRRLLSIE